MEEVDTVATAEEGMEDMEEVWDEEAMEEVWDVEATVVMEVTEGTEEVMAWGMVVMEEDTVAAMVDMAWATRI